MSFDELLQRAHSRESARARSHVLATLFDEVNENRALGAEAAKFYSDSEEERKLCDLCVSLRSNPVFPPIFALLLGEWMFASAGRQTPSHVVTFIKGANRLFWFDMEREQRAFAGLYASIKEAVFGTDPEAPLRAAVGHADYVNLLCRVCLYYDDADSLPSFLHHIDLLFAGDVLSQPSFAPRVRSVSPPARTSEDEPVTPVSPWDGVRSRTSSDGDEQPEEGAKSWPSFDSLLGLRPGRDSSVDVLVSQSIRQARTVRNETVLIEFLGRFAAFGELELGRTASVRLQATLHDFSHPGGPLYATRNVRSVARKLLDKLYPHGRYAKKVIRGVFALLRPYQTVSSILFWTQRIVHDVLGRVGAFVGSLVPGRGAVSSKK